jgi:acyl carrier protein
MERTQLSAIVLDLLEKETGETYDTLEDSTTLSEGLGLDSLDMAGLILHIESHFGIQIETELLDKINNVGQILDTLEEKIAAKEGKNAA